MPPLSDIRELEDIDPQFAFAARGAIPASLGDDTHGYLPADEMLEQDTDSPDNRVAADLRDDTPEPAA